MIKIRLWHHMKLLKSLICNHMDLTKILFKNQIEIAKIHLWHHMKLIKIVLWNQMEIIRIFLWLYRKPIKIIFWNKWNIKICLWHHIKCLKVPLWNQIGSSLCHQFLLETLGFKTAKPPVGNIALFVLWVQCCVLRRKCKWASLPDRFDEGFITSKNLEADNILPGREHHDSISWLTLQHIFALTFCTICVHVSAVGGADYPPVKRGISCTVLIKTQISQHTQLHQWPVLIALL